ncbi:MAG: hypothetical protein OEN56_02660 [Gemmatimonadota bacterium]|nr:hypothetical protein [Gemmatimonadota bacterium]
MIRWYRRTPSAQLLSTLAVLGLAGCGNLTAGGFGEAIVVMSGDAPDDGASPQTSNAQSASPQSSSVVSSPRPFDSAALVSSPGPSSHDDSPEGEVEAEFSLFLVAGDGDLVPLTNGDIRVRVDLEGVEEPQIASRSVTATTYTGLRMVFTEIEAEVDAGLIIGGEPVTGPIDVEIDIVLPVTKPLDLEIGDGERVEILIDLNAERWLLAVDPVTKTVDAQVFAELVSVVVR